VDLTFTSDHGVLKDKNDGPEDGGAVYSQPEWSVNHSYPITHTFNQKVSLSMNVKVEPASLPSASYDITGTGLAGLNFSKTATLSSGENPVLIESTNKLSDEIGVASGDLNWTVKMGDKVFCSQSTSSHKIYVLAGTPDGSQPTEWRISWATGKANGSKTAIASLLNIHTPRYQYNSPYPSQLWTLADGTTLGECIAMVRFDNLAIRILGWPGGEVMLGYVKLGKSSMAYAQDGQWEKRNSNTEKLLYVDKKNQPNSWEAFLQYTENGKTILLGGGAFGYDTLQELMEAVVQYTIWVTMEDEFVEDAELWDD